MKMTASRKPAQIALLFAILVASIIVASSAPSSNVVSMTGSVSYLPPVIADVNVNVDFTKATSINYVQLGFMIDQNWKTWRDSTSLRFLAQDASLKFVRIFDVRVKPCTSWSDSSKSGTFNWADMDLLVQRIIAIGAEPLICIGYCWRGPSFSFPPGMALTSTGLPNPDSFAAYAKAFVVHFKAVGLSVKYYEIINEAWYYFYPNWTWYETKAGYFLQFFNRAYDAMHAESPSVHVGNDASTLRKFLDYWIPHGGKLDFFSFHKYDGDNLSTSDSTILKNAENRFFVSDSLRYGIADARTLWFSAHRVILEAMSTETNVEAYCATGTDPRIQQIVGGVWTALMLRSSVLYGANYSTYYAFGSSKSWETANKANGWGFGMVNTDDNKPWYPYYVYKMIGNNLAVGDRIVETTSSSNDVRSLAWLHEGKLMILIIDKANHPKTIGLKGTGAQLAFSKIDGTISAETPRVQVGEINSKDPLTSTGYSVILLQASA